MNKKVDVSPEINSVRQARIEANKKKREDARRNRAAQGIPVEPGQTWQDLSAEQRADYFDNHENTWKNRYNTNQRKKRAGGMQTSQRLERGDAVNVKI